MKRSIERASTIERTPRVAQLEGLFDLPPSQRSAVTWDVDLPVEERDWNVGLIVGPSGTGKSTVVRELWPDAAAVELEWPANRSVVDGFADEMGAKDIVELLSSVGFSSPPSWLRPFHVLSNGEQFRATIARLLSLNQPVTVVDEFTSVVDRTVAKVASCAIAKAVRRRDQKFVAVTCHYDVEEWLQPDWVYQPHLGEFVWRSVQPRPRIDLDVFRSDRTAWRLFGPHHYLSSSLNPAAAVWIGAWGDQPVVMLAMLSFPHPAYRRGYRISRIVTLPDFQGVGIGNRFCEFIAGIYKADERDVFITTGHPANVRAMNRSSSWRMTRQPSRTSATGDKNVGKMKRASTRLTAGFQYVGPPVDSPLLADLVSSPRAKR